MRFPLLGKAAAIVAVVVLLSVLMMHIEGLVSERRMRQHEAVANVEASLAESQTLIGPVLMRTCSEEWTQAAAKDRVSREETREFVLHATPQHLSATSRANAEPRYRGLFKINAYAGASELHARWHDLQALVPQATQLNSRLRCQPAVLWLAVSDVRGIRSVQLQIDATVATVQPGTTHAAFPRGLHAVLDSQRMERLSDPLEVKVQLELLGTQRLSLVPAAEEVQWAVNSDWPHPSFGGRFLPGQREVGEQGFSALWKSSALANSAAADVRNGLKPCAATVPMTYGESERVAAPEIDKAGRGCLDAFSVAFVDPINPYVLADRATKYALLFIGLTFCCVGLVEVLGGRRVHPVQYTLVGVALATFYLLLLSLSEHFSFGLAYALASTACVLLLAYYAAHMLGATRHGLAFGAGVGGLYGLLWVLLRMEQAALLVGALMLFSAVALTMALTRRIDWYQLVTPVREGVQPST